MVEAAARCQTGLEQCLPNAAVVLAFMMKAGVLNYHAVVRYLVGLSNSCWRQHKPYCCCPPCRRQARASKQLGGRVMADTDRAFSEGADVEQWQRWAAGPTGLGSDGSGRAGKR